MSSRSTHETCRPNSVRFYPGEGRGVIVGIGVTLGNGVMIGTGVGVGGVDIGPEGIGVAGVTAACTGVTLGGVDSGSPFWRLQPRRPTITAALRTKQMFFMCAISRRLLLLRV